MKHNFIFDLCIRSIAALLVVSVFLFLIDNTLIHWFNWPGLKAFAIHLGLLDSQKSVNPLLVPQISQSWIEVLIFASAILVILFLIIRFDSRQLIDDSKLYDRLSAFIVRAAFWAVLLVGIVDMFISFLRVEGLLGLVLGDHLTTQLGRSIFRGTYIHFPLILISVVIALFTRTLGFIWLALLLVIAEFIIVISRFVFSYEQAFMGDLVRFWYAGLFLFASAYTLLHDGHVRVDVLYTHFSNRAKATVNICGALFLGLPLCWNILIQGMSGRGSIINSPLLSFEISQSGYGMYTKYLMSAYLVIFAVSMSTQFTSFILSNISKLREVNPINNNSNTQDI